MKTKLNKLMLLIVFAVAAMNGQAAPKLEKDSVLKIAKEAYIYGLPLILTDLTRIGSGVPVNHFHHSNQFPDFRSRLVVRPNNDTFYSSAFLDLGAEPVVLSIPDSKERYFVVPLMDAWTNVFKSFGKRTTGTKAQTYVITGPKWKGILPAGIEEIKSPTDEVWIIGRYQVNSPEDGKTFVVPIQNKLTVTPLSKWSNTTAPAVASVTYSIESTAVIGDLKSKKLTVVEALNRLSVEQYFTYLNELLVKNPGLLADKKALVRFAKIGILPGKSFNLNQFSEDTRLVLNSLPVTLADELSKNQSFFRAKNDEKIDLTIGNYGTDYLKRGLIAYVGLGALNPEEAVYRSYSVDADNRPLEGKNKYLLHFDAGKLPPARAFWSVTLYDKDGYLVDNPIDRYAIGDRNDLKFNSDGSLDLYIQNQYPGADKKSNWLPAPIGNFNLSVRIYLPTDDFLHKEGSWVKPLLKKLQ
ncbi:protein of unknown function DUF1254 [Paludibacter propionicigenes WB4]|uniref:DUF1254 domain-containing protein n=1 Tax=Paludibacter propionicigenes (strain DSM 17365 / JCM 13257 / WB4) TaxID=694427 RepID=E4T4V6_PALPW|nr:DUF1254 domain-containing protein [Paludibacter propionicigenes]ADQ79750.1 protein of unknown function DUF1254 [Paludibacter propionicigenes WB4]